MAKTEPMNRLNQALRLIDDFNRQDPRRVTVAGQSKPQELAYSERLTKWVLTLNPTGSEELRVAARGQHVGRWSIPRDRYEMSRGGYLRWREALKAFHAGKVGEILREVGYDNAFVQRVQTMILKKDLKTNPDTQTLEDGLCLVFLEDQFDELRAKTPEDKMKVILKKSWDKMSPKGRDMALQIPLSEGSKRMLASALAETS